MIKPEKILYTAHATSTGGRDGTSKTDDGVLDVKLTTPKGLGGNGAVGTNPEQLFAAGYSACFIGAMKFVADACRRSPLPADTSINADVGIGPIPQGFGIQVCAARPRSPAWTRTRRRSSSRPRTGLPVLERDPRQRRGHARRRLSRGAPAARGAARRAATAGSARPAPDRRERRRPTAKASARLRGRRAPSRQRRRAQHRRRRAATLLAQRRGERAVRRAVAGGGDDRCRRRRRRPAHERARPSAPARAGDDLDPRPAGAPPAAGDRGPSAASAATARSRRRAPSSTRAERPGVARRERIEPRRVNLAHVAAPSAASPAKAHDHAGAPGRGATAIASAQVARSVGLARGRRPHRRRSAPPAWSRRRRGPGSRRSPRACRCRG